MKKTASSGTYKMAQIGTKKGFDELCATLKINGRTFVKPDDENGRMFKITNDGTTIGLLTTQGYANGTSGQMHDCIGRNGRPLGKAHMTAVNTMLAKASS